ncbi:hypothetical protein ACNKHO_17805 [Shigella flexneri]
MFVTFFTQLHRGYAGKKGHFQMFVYTLRNAVAMSAGAGVMRIDKIGHPRGIDRRTYLKVDHLNYTNLRRCAGFFLPVSPAL